MKIPLTKMRLLYLAAAGFLLFDVSSYRQMRVMAQAAATTSAPATTAASAPATIQVYWANEHTACTVPNPGFKVGEQHTATFMASMAGQVGGAASLSFAAYLRHISNGSSTTEHQIIPDAIIIPFPLAPGSPCPTITWS